MVKESEMQRILPQLDYALRHDSKPSVFLSEIAQKPVFEEAPFCMLKKLRHTEQSPLHHPEGNVWNHTMLVLDEAASVRDRSKAPQAFMWAALLHDIGKPATTKNKKGRITAYDHDKLGAKLAKTFLHYFTDDKVFINQVSALVRWHMQIMFVIKDMPYADISGMMRETDINEIALLGCCDRMGRLGTDRNKEEDSIRIFLAKCLRGSSTTSR